jgi:hypothetical protein
MQRGFDLKMCRNGLRSLRSLRCHRGERYLRKQREFSSWYNEQPKILKSFEKDANAYLSLTISSKSIHVAPLEYAILVIILITIGYEPLGWNVSNGCPNELVQFCCLKYGSTRLANLV